MLSEARTERSGRRSSRRRVENLSLSLTLALSFFLSLDEKEKREEKSRRKPQQDVEVGLSPYLANALELSLFLPELQATKIHSSA